MKKNYQIFHPSVKIINNEAILLAWPLNNMLQSLIAGTYRHFSSTFPSLSISPDSTSFIDWLILDLLPQSHRRYLNLHKLIASVSRLWPSWALTRSGSSPGPAPARASGGEQDVVFGGSSTRRSGAGASGAGHACSGPVCGSHVSSTCTESGVHLYLTHHHVIMLHWWNHVLKLQFFQKIIPSRDEGQPPGTWIW